MNYSVLKSRLKRAGYDKHPALLSRDQISSSPDKLNPVSSRINLSSARMRTPLRRFKNPARLPIAGMLVLLAAALCLFLLLT